MYQIDLFLILFFTYLLQVSIHMVLCYKIMKYERIISGFVDFMMKANSFYPLMLQIILGRKNSPFIMKLFRINFLLALIVFISMIFMIIY